MHFTSTLATALAAAEVISAETVIGTYIFSRHGDRTAKATPPSNLTDLGYEEVFTSGTYFRNRYIAEDASRRIYGINSDLVKQSQLTASAPVDTVLQNSAVAFLQGLYPPVGQTLGSNTLRNGTVVQSPLNGYQLIPLQNVQTGAGSEDAAWLQGSTNCLNAQISSNNYFISQDYLTTSNQTHSLYQSTLPMVDGTFNSSTATYENAYTVWDLLNVASIHNSSDNFPNADLLTPELFYQLRVLADKHEWNLAYNESEPIRAVTGSIIAAEILKGLNSSITGNGKKNMLNIQFGAYGGMFSFFGLANLTAASPDFYGVPDYASTLTWELVTNASVSKETFPSTDEISVRFLFHNGTTSSISTPVEYPLFGQSVSPLPWNDFVAGMDKFSIKDQAGWCKACGNSTGVCSSEFLNDTGDDSSSASSSSSSDGSGGGGGGISKVVAGVIGAMVTLAVILGAALLIILVGGFRLVSKKRLARSSGEPPANGAKA